MSSRSLLIAPVQLCSSQHGPTERCLSHISVMRGVESPGVEGRSGWGKGGMEFGYQRHKVAIVVDISASLFQLAPGQSLVLETLEDVLFRLWNLLDKSQNLVLSVIFCGASTGNTVAVHSYPVLSLHHVSEVMLSAQSTLLKLLQTPPSSASLASLLDAGSFALSLMPQALPCLILLSDFICGSLPFSYYGNLLMDIQSKDIQVLLWPLVFPHSWGFLNPESDLKMLAEGLQGLIVRRADDIDERVFMRISRLRTSRSLVNRTNSLHLASYQSECAFSSFLRCRLSEGFSIFSFSDENVSLHRKFTHDLDLEITVEREKPLKVSIQVFGVVSGSGLRSRQKSMIAGFVRKMKLVEAILATMERREPPAASLSVLEHLLPCRWVSLLSPQSLWSQVKFSLQQWSSEVYSDMLYLREDLEAVTWVRVERCWESLVELLVIDWRGERDLQALREEMKRVGCWVYDRRLSTILIEELSGSGQPSPNASPKAAASFLISCSNTYEFHSENAVNTLAELIEEHRKKEGFVRLETLDRGKKLFVRQDEGIMLQYLLTLTPSYIRIVLYTLPHSPPPLLTQDQQLYTHFSHFRYLQCLCLSQLTNQDGGPKRFVDENLSTCAVFKMLMRTLGEEGQGMLAMVSEDDYVRCFGEMDRVELYRELYRRLREVEDADTPVESMADFLAALEAESKQLWQPGSSDLYPLILATFQSVSDYSLSQSGFTYFFRHISSWELLIWRMREGIQETTVAEVFRYRLRDGRVRGDAEIAWNLAEKALGAALTHYVFDELFHSNVPLSDLLHTLTLCNHYTVSISLSTYQLVMEKYEGQEGLDTAVQGLETSWKQLWSQQFEVHADNTVFYSKHPTQLLFLQLNPCQSALYPALLPPSLQLTCYSHSSHGFSTAAFRKSIQSLIEEFKQGIERIIGEFELEVLRLVGVLDSETVATVSSLLSVVTEALEVRMELDIVHGGSEEDIRKELRSEAVLKLREVGNYFVLVSAAGLSKSRQYFPAASTLLCIPFWLLITIHSPSLIVIQAVIPLDKRETGLTSAILLDDIHNVRDMLEIRVNQRVLLRKVMETGICSHLLSPGASLSLPLVQTLPLSLSPRLSCTAAMASISSLFATVPYQVQPQKDLYRLVVAPDTCVLFRITTIDLSSLGLEVYSLDTLDMTLISPIRKAAKDQITALSITLLASALLEAATITDIDIGLIATDSRNSIFPMPNPSGMSGYLRQVLAKVLREMEKQKGGLGYLYNSLESGEMGEGLAWIEVNTISTGIELSIKASEGVVTSQLESLLERCVSAGICDYKVENESFSDPFVSYASIQSLATSFPSFCHYCPLSSLSQFTSALSSVLQEELGKEVVISIYQSGRDIKGLWLEGKTLITARCEASETMLYESGAEAHRSLFCCLLVSARELEGICYNFAYKEGERIREKLGEVVTEYKINWGKICEERMAKLGLIGRQCIMISQQFSPSPLNSPIPHALTPLYLTSEAPIPLDSPISLSPHPSRLQRYQDLLQAFDPWSHRHHLTLPLSLLTIIEDESFLAGFWNTESTFLLRMQGNTEGWEIAEQLLWRVREGAKERLVGFEEVLIGRGGGKMKRSRTDKELGKGLGRSPVYLKRVLNDSLLLLSLSLDPPFFSFRLSCLQSLLRILNPMEPQRSLDYLHKEVGKCRRELKGKRLVFDAEAGLLGDLLLHKPVKVFRSLFEAGKELVGNGNNWSGIEGDFSLDTGPFFSQSLAVLFSHMASQPSEFHLFPYSDSPMFLFQIRNSANQVLLPTAFSGPSPASAGDNQVGVVIMYRESLFRSRKVLGLTSTPSINIINLEYLVITRGAESKALHRAIRSLMAEAVTRAIRGVQREMGWSRVLDRATVTAEEISSLLANSFQLDISEDCRQPLNLLQGVFSIDIIDYLREIHGNKCRLVEDQTNWHLLIVISSAEIVYLKVNKLEGRLEISPLIRSLPPASSSFFSPVIKQVFHWLFLQLAC